MTTRLEEGVGQRLAELTDPDATVLVAVSGGCDSTALLELLHASREIHHRRLMVVHLDHGITPESSTIANKVAGHAARLDLPFEMTALRLGPDCSETRARDERRRWLLQRAAEHAPAVIAMAHHADDQAETILMRLLRGSGPIGLAGMAMRRGPWLRPLLDFSRQDLADYLSSRAIDHWDDPANSDPRHLRSWLRGEVMPSLRRRLPDLDERLVETGQHAAELAGALNMIPELLTGLDLRSDSRGVSVAAGTLNGYRSGVRRLVVGALARRLGANLGGRQLERVTELLAGGVSGHRVQLVEGLEAELGFDRLHLHRPAPDAPSGAILPRSGTLHWGRWQIVAKPMAAPSRQPRGGFEAWLPRDDYRVRAWRTGDRIRPLGGNGSRRVVVLLREERVIASDRADWPMVVPAREPATIVWVPGICRSGLRVPEPGEEAIHVECNHN